MTFPRIRASAAWAADSTFLATEADTLDGDHANAIDGAGGGTYAPSTAITIGGSGLDVTGPLDSSGGVSVTAGAVTVSDPATLAVSGTSTFTGAVVFDTGAGLGPWYRGTWKNGVTAVVRDTSQFQFWTGTTLDLQAGSTLQVDGTAHFTGSVQVDSPATVSWNNGTALYMQNASTLEAKNGATVNIDSGATFAVLAGATETHANSPTFSGGAAFTGGGVSISTPVSATKPITMGGGAIWRVHDAGDANQTIDTSTCDVVLVPTLTAGRSYTLANGVEGQILRCHYTNIGGTNTAQFLQSDGATPVQDGTLRGNTGTGNLRSVTLVYHSAQWVACDVATYS